MRRRGIVSVMFKDTLRWITIGGIFAVPIIVPFIVPSSMFFPYITGKNFTFRIIVEIILSAWVLLAMFDVKYRPRFSWILASFILFLVVIGLADILGENPFKSFWSNFERMEGYVTLLHLFAYFIVTSSVLNTEKLWNTFWYSTLGTSVVIAFMGLKPILSALPAISFPRIDASFGNPIYLAVYALFHIFIALILMERWRGTYWHQALLGFIALLQMVVMVLTQTRGTVLGFVVGMFVTTVLIAIFEKERKWLRFSAIGVLIAGILLVGTGFAIKDTNFAKTTPLVSRFTQVSFTSGTVHARFMNWGIAWQGVKERPILGWGQGNYEYVFSKYFDPGMYNEEPWFDRTHDIIFDWLVAGGFLGVVSYFLILISAIVHFWFLDRDGEKWSVKKVFSFNTVKNLFEKGDYTFSGTERAVLTGLLIAYTIHNLFVFDNIISYILFVMVLAYIHFKATEKSAPMFSEVEIRKETITAVALPVVLVVCGAVVWYVNVPGIKTSQMLIEALTPQVLPSGQRVPLPPEDVLAKYKEALSYDQLGRQEVKEQLAQMATRMLRDKNVPPDVKDEFGKLAINELEKEIARNPNSARLRLFSGSVYGAFGQIDKAENEYRKVAEIAPTKQTALFQLGEILLVEKKNDEALKLFKRAYELEPKYKEATKLYATVLVRTGKDKEAVDLLTAQFGTPYVDDNRLFREWTNAKRYDVVAEILKKRIKNNPNDLQLKVSLAATYKELGEKDKAIKLLEEVKKANPEYSEQMNSFIKTIRGW